MNTRKQHSDYWLSLAIFALIVFGLIMIYSVSKYYSLQITNESTDKYYLIRQLRWVVVGLLVWIVFQAIDYRYWQEKAGIMLFVVLLLLCLPVVLGGGSGERWIGFGTWQFQPSELSKLCFIIYLSGWFSSRGDNLKMVRSMFLPFIAIMSIIAFLMLVQKDLGTLAVYVIISAVMLTIAGSSVYHLAAGGVFGVFLVWLAIKLEPYRMERVLTFLNPENNTLDSSYHIRNALIAIGSGGLWGLGFGQSRQKYLYLPEAHTDSIFAIISEELGFARTVFLIFAFTFIALRGIKIAMKAPDTFSRLLATGIITWLTAQALINIGAMLSILPLTGIPLPFVSYGGSSMIFLMAGVGILTNISKHAAK